jgi:hypothetical protein
MPLEVHTDDLVRAGAALRDLGDRVSSYGERLDRRVARVAHEVDGDVGDSLTRASHDLARALANLADGFHIYGGALAEVATHYAAVDSELTRHVPR